jgi:hypothetical protein
MTDLITIKLLEELVLEWASRSKPEEHALTVGVQSKPRAYRRYLQRLVEIRWADEPEWRGTVPLRALEDSAIRATFRFGSSVFECAGRRAAGPRQMSWTAMATIVDQGEERAGVLESALRELDLWVDPPPRVHPPRATEEPPDVPCAKCDGPLGAGQYICEVCREEPPEPKTEQGTFL